MHLRIPGKWDFIFSLSLFGGLISLLFLLLTLGASPKAEILFGTTTLLAVIGFIWSSIRIARSG